MSFDFDSLPYEIRDKIIHHYLPGSGDSNKWRIIFPDAITGEILANYIKTQLNLLSQLCANSSSELCQFIRPLVAVKTNSYPERLKIFQTIVGMMKAFGVQAENRVHTCQEIAFIAQSIEDTSLMTIWPNVVQQIQAIDPTIALNANLTAPQIRTCLAQNEEALRNLQIPVLDLSGQNLFALPKEIKYLKGIQNLNLSNNHLHSLPSEIELISRLDTLDLGKNEFTSLPPSVENMTTLLSLDLELNRLKTLPAGISKLVNLQLLDVSCNQLESVPPELCTINSLQSLDLSNNSLDSLDDAFGQTQMGNLVLLDLGDNEIETLPNGFGSNFPALETLHLESNNLKSLPFSIGDLGQLRHLDLCSNELVTVPRAIANLGVLVVLNLSSNKILALPNSDLADNIVFGNLIHLEQLLLNSNQLHSLPQWIGDLGALQTLNVNENLLTTLPDSIGNLNHLTHLEVMSNKLISLPTTIGGLGALVGLNARMNRLKTLPSQIGDLQNLAALDISANQIGQLPNTIGNLTSLVQFYLHSNQLTALPPQISQLGHLIVFNLENNPFLFVPQEIFQSGNPVFQNNSVLRVYQSELTCRPVSSFGKLYQSILLRKDPEILKLLFNELDSKDKKFICESLLVYIGRASIETQWALEHVFDEIKIFSLAVRKAISIKLLRNFSEAFHTIQTLANDNLVLIADEMARLEQQG